MRHSIEGIKKWRSRAIFINIQKTKITVLNEKKKLGKPRKIPERLSRKPLPKMKHTEKVTMQRLSITELLSGALTIISFVVFVFIKMFQLEIQNQESITQLNTYAALSLMIGITFLVTFSTSMILRRVFPGEM